ncbi:Helix-turn-helix protein [Hyphomicrobiales bacterium]|nr:Helix-turn-helix protein [Hyphomicrobiales bacterium]CAH1674178.1 Helix-turn-helix protein [Hyphomicrobiales bacterium]
MNLRPEQCRAARGLLDWTQDQLATAAGVSRSTVRDFECHRHELQRTTETLVVKALEEAGVRFLPANREGPGVRLKKPAAPLVGTRPSP